MSVNCPSCVLSMFSHEILYSDKCMQPQCALYYFFTFTVLREGTKFRQEKAVFSYTMIGLFFLLTAR